jgi:predicted amidophosphoribosyltransferase
MSSYSNQVLCRNCKEPMKQAPQGVLAFYCHKCNVKAEINYSEIPIVKLKELSE